MDPDPHESQNFEALEAQNRALKDRGRSHYRTGGSKKWSLGGSVD
jgi:hypothetical protein